MALTVFDVTQTPAVLPLAGGTVTGVVTSTAPTGNTLVIDTPTFVVDATNNRVGIGTATPSQILDVKGPATDATTLSTQNWSGLGNNSTFTLQSFTRSVSTTAKIMDIGWSGIMFVTGDNGSATFTDIVTVFVNGSLTVVNSATQRGAPAARTYTNSGVGAISLAMASGTYNVQAICFALSGR